MPANIRHGRKAFARQTAFICLSACLGTLSLVPDSSAQNENRSSPRIAGRRPPDRPTIVGQPLETRAPIGRGQKPARSGQTRAVAVATRTPLKLEVVATGLRNPWSLAFLPDGKMLVTERPGAMRVIDRNGAIGPELEGVPKVVSGQEIGLLDVALDPSFSTSRLIYLAYVEPREGGRGVTVARAKLREDLKGLDDLTSILRVESTGRDDAHFGSRLMFDKEGKLFVSLSERIGPPDRDRAQKLDSGFGKILRINPDGTPAPGNPFATTSGAMPEIWSYGHRDPQGLAIHPETGQLWETETSPRGGDELNVVEPGKNYGWPTISYGTESDGTPFNEGRTAGEGLEQPTYYWDPPIEPSGATFYVSDQIPEWRNNLFVAALAGQHLSRLALDGHRVVGEERFLLDLRQGMRDVRLGPDGALWILTDGPNGRLIRLFRNDR